MTVAPICFKTCYKDQTVCNSGGGLVKPYKSMIKCASFLRSISANSSDKDKSTKFVLKSSSKDKHLESLDSYFGKFKENTDRDSPNSLNKNLASSATRDDQGGLKSDYDETSGLYLIGTIASLNIAVYLFEIASPVKNSDLDLFSLPALYGAKINHLIVYGEWWRLLTPMFLVQD